MLALTAVLLLLVVTVADGHYAGQSTDHSAVVPYTRQQPHPTELCPAYLQCYGILTVAMRSTFHSFCRARDQFKKCKSPFEKAVPNIHLICRYLEISVDKIADNICTSPDGETKYRAYLTCPYTNFFVPVYDQLFDARKYVALTRCTFSQELLYDISFAGFSAWKDPVFTSLDDPSNPVYGVVANYVCAQLLQDCCNIFSYVDKYCIKDAKVMSDMWCQLGIKQEAYSNNITFDTSLCDDFKFSNDSTDCLGQSAKIMNLGKYLESNINPSLPICHPNNILVCGMSCLVRFHATSPPYTALSQLLPGMCKGLPELTSCWKQTTAACPGSHSGRGGIHAVVDIVGLHSAVCEMQASKTAGSAVLEWAKRFQQRGINCQRNIQQVNGVCDVVFNYDIVDASFHRQMLGLLNCLLESLRDMAAGEGIVHLYRRLKTLRDHVTGTHIKIDIQTQLFTQHYLAVMGHLYKLVSKYVNLFLITNLFVNYDPNGYFPCGPERKFC